MNYNRALYRLTQKILTLLMARANFRISHTTLLRDELVPPAEKRILRDISLRVHRNDGMYLPASGRHYFSVGLSALRCIERAIADRNGAGPVRSILDFPCGYGRVCRFLRVRFPEALIAAYDLDRAARRFCARAFGARPVGLDRDVTRLSGDLPANGRFDIIWCGSLLTHLDALPAERLLAFFHDRLAPGGVCVFTTHGRFAHQVIRDNKFLYALTAPAQQKILAGFETRGYGYADYDNSPGYGVSLATAERMREIAGAAGDWRETLYVNQGWDNHQDVWAYTRDG
jgi:SAM-dependent methyltransferase